MEQILLELLDNALDCGIKEEEFWNMSIGELNRAFHSFLRVCERQRKIALNNSYTLADLIACSISRLFSEEAEYLPIEAYFPDVFPEEYKVWENKQAELEAQQFLQVAQSFNRRFEGKK